jgi:monoamine oxidase
MSQRHIECKTLIVGAGISGIAASIELLNNNYDDFLIIESQERIGGRCFTLKHG